MRLGDRLGIDRATASQTYYACLLMYSGCNIDAQMTTETFGGSLSSLVPVTFGSQREVLAGLLRALPTPGSSAPARAIQIARRLPRAGRERDPHMAAICEVAQMLAERLGLAAPVRDLFAHLTERWDGKGPLGRAKGEEISLAIRIVHVARDAAVQRMLGGEAFAVRVVRERAGHAFDPQVAACLADGAAEILALGPEASAWEETLACEPQPQSDAGGRGDRSGAGRDRRLRRPDLAVSVRPLGRRGGAGARGGAALPHRRGGRRHDPARGARPRPRARRGPPADLAEARSADRGRVGAGAAAPVPHRARPLALAVPGGARAGRGRPPRAPRRLRLPPRNRRRGARAAGAPARRRRRVPRDDRAAAAPRAAAGGAGGGRARPRGERRAARRRRGDRGRRGGRPARCRDSSGRRG